MPDFARIAETALDRIARFDPHLHAFALVEPEWVREEAWRQDKAAPKGPLAGLTLAVKDLLDLRGLATGGGCRTPVIADAPANAAAVDALMAAGMLTLGKTHTVELAFGTWGINRATATPRNPWDAATVRVPGGSSSGSAVAVAAGLADAALGTDTGGSIRIPSALNNVVGLKPTRGRVPMGGCLPLCPELDTIGPLARTVERVARMLGALRDPAAGPVQPGPKLARQAQFDADAALAASPRGLILAVLPDRFMDGVDGAVGAAYLAALARLEALGVKLVEAAPAINPSACVEPSGLLMAGRAWRLWQRRIDHYDSEMDAGVLGRLRGGEDISDAELTRLIKAQAQDKTRFYAWAQDFDAIATPTVPIPAPALADADEGRLPFSRFVRMGNWLDLPALAVPCGATDTGLPLSLQLLSTPWREAVLVTLGHAYQCATDWADRRPDLGAIVAMAAGSAPASPHLPPPTAR
ncbi:amidase [Niveispirillum sp.]|uniref:amidase n=1 Tax=Niveispirillum sp. TaxID=1917217 RepID=UPI001B7B608F|nr:amidase [Niveispirillum sp.]MBP7335063.1 amidase [Niveispirillum sp.]